jgi:hypothetical protein
MIREFLIKVDVPMWATHYSIDSDGAMYYYEEKPEVDEDWDGTMWIAKGRNEFSGVTLDPRLFVDWRETLHEIK